MLAALLFFCAVGGVAGLAAGLFGIGGGVIIVPALASALAFKGVDEALIMHLAIGTSLAIIVVTGASSAFGHWKKGAVSRDLLVLMLPGLICGAVLGGLVADHLDGRQLERFFGVFMLLLAAHMLLSKRVSEKAHVSGRPAMFAAGTTIGTFSALFGVGGGVLSVPWLARNGAGLTHAIGTSAACGLPIALVGALTFMMTGLGHAGLPEGSLGYLYWPAFAGVAMFSVPAARCGAKLAHYLSPERLRTLFALVMVVVGITLVL
ncbi:MULTISPECIES: sulfite exporter TauE/SafE family protein [Halomonas]|uniref:sulfite exporter TauE/SafE family protein n=1 Tax=Halomonas TaxID=2745 RepID=UPI001C9655FF|nr:MULTISPECIES: sulfite exporter TauE/SafE family protein [Halomonas]MBY5927396.1 sulfite exporter TauE/SafE family protein [Halomonas sp. DP4Y7-2]MBY5970638.1 sulfite exporter TauE/SafE family protein [Halomonas denitrificans]MBY6206862.1 sulfite exporter TauE/SafE family protein [Halomonas sp. DP3Y7-2]MBY6230556.1 sulfite exporter TauE/SafE family protein [Halomonas sp. DP3Y7-1]MBY6234437.1 sulfite exporter TauE/SafE family protein [Halomonas sp. DP4Y7-1]